MWKKLLLFSLIIAVLNLFFYYTSSYNLKRELNKHNETLADKFYMEYNTVVKDFYNLSDFIVDAYIYNNPKILEQLYISIIHNKDTEKTRKEILDTLLPVLNKIKQKGYSQIHFIDYKGYSFLRLHLPEVFGDDLKPVRGLISTAIEEKRKIMGLEVGRHEIAYRAIYPLFYKGTFIGLIDLALNSNFLINHMNKELDGSYNIIIKKSSAKSMKEDFFLRNYKQLKHSSDFYLTYSDYKKELYDYFHNILINEKIDLSPKQKTININDISISFIPIFDISKNFIGHVVKMEKDNFLMNLKKFRTINISLFIMLSLTMFLFIFTILKKNNELQKELKEKDEYAQKLSELNRLYNLILESSDQIVYDYNINTGVVVRSGSLQKILGITSKDFSQTTILDFIRLIHPEDRDKVSQFLKEPKKEDTKFTLRYRLKRSDGTYSYIHDQGLFIVINQEKHILGTMKDVTPIIKYEETLQQAQRLESIGILAGGIAHDFNNLLAGMWNYIDQTLKRPIDDRFMYRKSQKRIRKSKGTYKPTFDLFKRWSTQHKSNRYQKYH